MSIRKDDEVQVSRGKFKNRDAKVIQVYCTVVGMSSTWRTSTVRKEVVSAHAHTLSPHLLTQDSTSLNQA